MSEKPANGDPSNTLRRTLSAPVATFVALALGLALALPATAQNVEESDPEDDPSRETDVSEDNYRRFMELNDIRLERPAFPTPAAPTGTGIQKLDQLPEESQKHLRNQLRGIILARGAWTPEERQQGYGFVPSPAAREDAQLLRQEVEAWAELVSEYHDREAAIYAGSGGAQSPGVPGEFGGASQPGQPGQASPPGAGEQGQQSAQAAGENPQSPGAGQAPEGADGRGQGESDQARNGGANEGQDGEGDGDSAAGRTAQSTERPRDARAQPEAPTPQDPLTWDPDAEAGGVEQSAAEYLRQRGLAADVAPSQSSGPNTTPSPAEDPGRWGEDAQTLLPPPPSEAASSTNGDTPLPALPGLPADDAGTDSAPPTNILTLEELAGVRGLERTPAHNNGDAGRDSGDSEDLENPGDAGDARDARDARDAGDTPDAETPDEP